VWCYINLENIDKYLQQYPKFQNIWEELIILKIKDACFLPRLFYYNYPSEYLVQYFGKNKIEHSKINIKFNTELRPAQKVAASTIINIFNKQNFVNGIIKLPPGTGKTVLTVFLASQLGLKTCIILDNTSLLKQWIEAFIKFSNLTEEDIGLIKQKFFITNKPVTIAMAQTLGSKIKNKFNETIKLIDESKFGLVVYDEVHSTSATDLYSKTNVFFRTPNILGLSATPFHYGTQEILMNNTIGNIIVESNKYELTPEYKMIYYNSQLQKYTFVMNKMNDYIKQKAYYNKILLKSDLYLPLIVKLVQKAYHDGHKIIIVCMTIKQVQLISENLELEGLKVRQYTGKQTEIDKENDDIIAATYSFIGKGFDMSRLSCLILACSLSGKKSLIQVVGRILRAGGENKLKPIVYDLIDTCFPLLSVPEIKRKKAIISSEFPNCKLEEIKNG
jgi:superfamily II DNA or RNA helicase